MAIYPIFPGGKRKVFTLSYDDAWPQDKPLIELMNKYGVKGTFNVCSGDVRFTQIPNPTEVYKGHEIAVHGLTHVYLDRVTPQTGTYEIIKDRENLERIFGGTVRGCAYPYTAYNHDTPELLKNCGIVYARTAACSRKYVMPSDWYRWHPTCDHNDADLLKFGSDFLEYGPGFNQCWMFYVYGHANDFDKVEGRWERMEELLKLVGGRDDVWYATNIEIYDYIAAFKNLIMSVDSNYIYNPTTTTLSLIYSDQDFINSAVTLEIKPGEEIYLNKR